MTTKEKAAAIRAEYKKRGWNSRKISVRTEYFSLGSAINIEIKAPGIPTEEVEKIAKGIGESIARCHLTHEILSGGNTYVSVRPYEEAA